MSEKKDIHKPPPPSPPPKREPQPPPRPREPMRDPGEKRSMPEWQKRVF